jgi:hypothetical protein
LHWKSFYHFHLKESYPVFGFGEQSVTSFYCRSLKWYCELMPVRYTVPGLYIATFTHGPKIWTVRRNQGVRMAANQPIFTRHEIDSFLFELRSKFRSGIRSVTGIFYILMTLVGVGWASWEIPILNNNETSPETLGIYVIGFLVTVGLDALLTWKRTGDDNRYEQAIATAFMALSAIFLIVASILSIKTHGSWRCSAEPLLGIILIIAIGMSLVLTGFDSSLPPLGPLDVPVDDINDRGTNG